MNALFYDPLKQVVVDYIGGMKDIKSKKVKPIIPLTHIFTDDPVRMIRAVKYGAAAGFKLTLSLKYKIRKQSNLLSGISPSRLTEEISKIIHSSQAAAIVENLDAMGLYQYLQPQAVELFRTMPGFRERYLRTLAALNQADFKNLPGEAMAGLVRDFLETAADWKGGPDKSAAECYREAFIAARKFVLPMNPPRMELDHGVRLLFAEHGVSIKKSAFTERRGRLGGKAVHAQDAPEIAEEANPPGEGTAKKHRKRKRRPSAVKKEIIQ
jgi:poly(A) polymerase